MIREQIIHNVGSSFSHIVYEHFTMPWHYHIEYELILITSGGGKRFVGDYTDDFCVGDLVLLGSELPHYHMCYGIVENNKERFSGCEVIQFTDSIFPVEMGKLQEFSSIAALLERSKRGIKFTNPPSIDRVLRMMRYIDSLQGIRRINALYRILDILARSTKYKLMTSEQYSSNISEQYSDDLINNVYKYLHENFRKEISLDEISQKFGYNTSALCRHYKKRTQKSIMASLQEIRICFACKLLSDSRLNITQIAYESGYHNIANFNRQFKAITTLSPSSYRELYKTGL